MPQLLSRDGQPLTYIDIGKGPVCVLVHGIGMEARYWLPLVLPLVGRYRFILPDLRGFGQSQGSVHCHEDVFVQFADDLHDLITHLQLETFSLAGYSMGGMTSLMYQHRYGTDKLNGYLQIDQSPVVHNTADWPWGLYGDDQESRFAQFERVFAEIRATHNPTDWRGLPKHIRNNVKAMMAEFVAGATASKTMKKLIGLSHQMGAVDLAITHRNWPAYWQCISHYVGTQTDLRTVFEGYAIPLWVFVGTRSELYHVNGQHTLGQLVNDATVIPFLGKGHMLPYEAPYAFIKHLNQFIGTVAQSPSPVTQLS